MLVIGYILVGVFLSTIIGCFLDYSIRNSSDDGVTDSDKTAISVICVVNALGWPVITPGLTIVGIVLWFYFLILDKDAEYKGE